MNGQPQRFVKLNRSNFRRHLGDYFFLLAAINNPMTVNTIIRISYASIDITSFINVSKNREATPPDIRKIARG